MTIAELLDRAASLRMHAISSGILRLNELFVVIDPKVHDSLHDSPRHFAMCNENAREIRVAPELALEPAPIVDGILMHEIGHAIDFAYPAQIRVTISVSPGIDVRTMARRDATRADRAKWRRRTPYDVEVHADMIAEMVFGVRIGYVGDLMLQSTDGGLRPRPFGI